MNKPGSPLDLFKSWFLRWGPLGMLLLVSAALYGATMEYEASWDDALFLERSPDMGRLSSLSKTFTVDYFGFTDNPALPEGSPLYRPLALGFLILEKWLFGTDTNGFRLVHMIWHLLNIVLLFIFIRTMLGKGAGFAPLVAAAVFAFLPYTVDTVLFLTSVSDLMALCFTLLSSLCFLRWIGRGKWWRLGCVMLLSLGAMLCKESAVSITVLLPIVFWCQRDDRSLDRRALVAILGVFCAAGFFLVLRSFVVEGFSGATLAVFFKQLPAALVVGLRWAVFPFPLVLEQPMDFQVGDFFWWTGCGLLVLALWLLVRFGTRFKLLFAGGMIWFISVLPSFMALPWTGNFAPRYLYLPAIGLCLAVGYVASIRIRVLKVFLWAMVLVAAFSTVDRLASWKDSFTLWAVEVGRQPQSISALMNLGNLLAKRGDYKDALALQLKVAGVAENQNRNCVAAFAYSNAATISSRYLGDPAQGLGFYQRCIAMCPQRAQNAWIGMARIHADQKNWKAAEGAAREAEKFETQRARVLLFLAGILVNDGRPSQALECLEKARALVIQDPRLVEDIDRKIATLRNSGGGPAEE